MNMLKLKGKTIIAITGPWSILYDKCYCIKLSPSPTPLPYTSYVWCMEMDLHLDAYVKTLTAFERMLLDL